MTIFKDTMKEAVSVYRQMLRKQLTQVQRVKKLNELNLRKKNFEEFAEKELYDLGYSIISDIEVKNDSAESYYAYSGMARFADHLKNFLSNYVLEDGEVIHCLQKASNALVRAIQLLSTDDPPTLTDEMKQELTQCQTVIERFGSSTHKKNLSSLLERSQQVFYNAQKNFMSQSKTGFFEESPNKV